MVYLPNCMLLLLLIRGPGHLVLAHKLLSRRVVDPSVAVDSSTVVSSAQPHNNSGANSTANTFGRPSNSLNHVPTLLPSPFQSNDPVASKNYQDIISGFCAIDDYYCSFEGDNKIGNLSTKAFNDQCLLWDDSCSGNRTLAIDNLFNTTEEFLQANECFSEFSSGVQAGEPDITIPTVESGGLVDSNIVIPSDCIKYNPPERLSEWQEIKSWMRSPACVLAENEWTKKGGKALKGLISTPSEVTPSCCGLCDVGVNTVDLYFWPDADANTSCTSIIGTDISPVAYGATTSPIGSGGELRTSTWWACSLKTPATSTYTYPGTNSGAAETITSVHPMITTAEVITVGSLAIKVSLLNPWSSSPCIDADSSLRGSNGSNSASLHARHEIKARNHALVNQSSITKDDGLPVSTAVLGNFTL